MFKYYGHFQSITYFNCSVGDYAQKITSNQIFVLVICSTTKKGQPRLLIRVVKGNSKTQNTEETRGCNIQDELGNQYQRWQLNRGDLCNEDFAKILLDL